MDYEQLKLENQLCFPVYAVSRLITREYQPLLEKLGITYPQYLVLMLLWEKEELPVNDIAGRLILNTNTVTPLLKRMEKMGLLKRTRSEKDERKVMVHLTEQGVALREEAVHIPEDLAAQLSQGPLDVEDLVRLKKDLDTIISFLSGRNKSRSDG